jgi:hypothetical protein
VKKIFFLLGMIALLAPSLNAANRAGPWMINPTVGYFHYASKRHVDPQAIAGLGAGYSLSDQAQVEFWVGHLSSNYSDRNDDRNIKGYLYNLDGLYLFLPASPVQPYILGGLGETYLKPATGNDPTTEAHIQAGAGVSYLMSAQISARADVEDMVTMAGGKHDILANAGLVFYFG